jgi:hypothetical protein
LILDGQSNAEGFSKKVAGNTENLGRSVRANQYDPAEKSADAEHEK